MDWFQRFIDSSVVVRLAERLAGASRTSGPVTVRGSVGSSTILLAAAVQRRTGRPVLLVAAHLDEADEAVDVLESLGLQAARLAAVELLPGETAVSLELLAERLMLVERLTQSSPPQVIVAPIPALMQLLPAPGRLGHMLRVFRVGDALDPHELAQWLSSAGYARVSTIDASGEFAIRGGVIDIFPPGGAPSRIDLFGTQIEGLFEIDLATMGSDRRIDRVELVGASTEALQSDEGTACLTAYLPSGTIAILSETAEIMEQGRSYYDRAVDARGILAPSAVFKEIVARSDAVAEVSQHAGGAGGDEVIELDVRPIPTFTEDAAIAVAELNELAAGCETVVLCQNDGESQRLKELLEEFTPADVPRSAVQVMTRYLHRGHIWHLPGERPLVLVPYHELLHRYYTRRRARRMSTGRGLDAFIELQPGDFVVHRDHGIGRFVALRTLKDDPSQQEYLTLEFAGRTTIHVPAPQIDLVQKYVAPLHGKPELSTVGGKSWKRQKEKVADAVRDLAAEMLRIQAAREAMPGIHFPADTAWQHEFEAEFPYEETEDQLAALTAIKRDMTAGRPMDRLVCGDVGFGKTELAIRAAFKAAEFGKQVAVLVPTTVLAEQHERTFCQRFADYPFRIESISRFKTKKEQTAVLADLAKGQIDVVIGTHRLLSKDVRFADLGLVIIDEEQRFGVEHKHRLLEFRMTADVLTLSATPIPRTLHMAMLGLRDISSLSTPPLDRRAIVTEVIPYDSGRLRQAIQRELAREGQVYFVHNRVYNIKSVADDVRRLVPDARIVVGHGQMSPRELEKVMLTFMRRQADILVCTTIIESGIDIPTVNTMFINDAHMFGLSELHQLRGRVGRYKHRAYCYMLLPRDRTLSEVAVKRLRAIETFSMLGAGFQIALRDLEIRGAGNLLGAEQSGHIAAVGYELYCQLLEQAVSDLREDRPPPVIDTVIDVGATGSLPRGYIPSDVRRMDAYRRISRASTAEALGRIEHDLVSAYGDLPKAADLLLQVAGLRVAAASLGIQSITRHEDDIIVRTMRPGDIERHMGGTQGSLRIVGQPDEHGQTTVYFRPPKAFLEPATLLAVLRRRLQPGGAPDQGTGQPVTSLGRR